MRVFWSLIVGLILLSAIVVMAQRGGGNPPGPAAENTTAPAPRADQPAAPAPEERPRDETPEAPATTEREPEHSPAAPGADERNATVLLDADEAVPVNPREAKHSAERREDGSLVLDGRYVVRGSGTREDPYVIPWDLLVSAQDTYQPRLGMTDIPERVQMMHDKWVKITGYIAFPLMVSQSDEILLMLNQWDGCCIGVPPTPYDGIEARLARAVPASAGINIFHFGAVTGILKVDPYIVNNWLVGLYLMEEASIEMEL